MDSNPSGPPCSTASGLLDSRSPDPRVQRELAHWLRFQSALGLRPQLAAVLLRRTGNPSAALRESGYSCPLRPADLEKSLSLLRHHGVRALPLLARGYPERLARLSDPAALLLLRGAGEVELLSRPSVGIVGARAASVYGLHFARQLASDLAAAGVVVISGLARGIDAAAHAGALAADGLTVAIQACGPEQIYPRQNRALAREIEGRGLLVTEMAPGRVPLPAYFPLRNRLISALAHVVIVVEARLRSGSLLTARHALDQGGEVMAVPGPVGVATSEGTNRLIRDGARPVLEVADVLEELGMAVGLEGVGSPEADPRPAEPAARRILSELRRQPASREDLAARLGLAPSGLAAVLLEMELDGWLRPDRDGRLVAVSSSARARAASPRPQPIARTIGPDGESRR